MKMRSFLFQFGKWNKQPKEIKRVISYVLNNYELKYAEFTEGANSSTAVNLLVIPRLESRQFVKTKIEVFRGSTFQEVNKYTDDFMAKGDYDKIQLMKQSSVGHVILMFIFYTPRIPKRRV